MSELQESWARTGRHLRLAAAMLAGDDLHEFHEYLDQHNELELAADVLFEFGTRHEELPASFWEAMLHAYENMGLPDQATMCRFRIYEAKFGFLEARLTLFTASDGGRSRPIFTDYRPDWNIGNRFESGEVEINGARVSLEDAKSIAPGESGVVRLHPTLPEAWRKVQVGAEINMHEGPHVVGKARVLRVALRLDGTNDPQGSTNAGSPQAPTGDP
jgi:hypothetical protein